MENLFFISLKICIQDKPNSREEKVPIEHKNSKAENRTENLTVTAITKDRYLSTWTCKLQHTLPPFSHFPSPLS